MIKMENEKDKACWKRNEERSKGESCSANRDGKVKRRERTFDKEQEPPLLSCKM